MRRLDVTSLPQVSEPGVWYQLPPTPRANEFNERVDRNIGFITTEEQHKLGDVTIGVAGTGGMGGYIGAVMQRIGCGAVKIADSEVFDHSNRNRQFGATESTVGVSKALATGRMLRDIASDCQLDVFPQGITAETVSLFVSECDLIADEIEFWAIGSRILLHQHARAAGVTIFNCNTVGFGTRLFQFRPEDQPIEESFGLTLEEAMHLQTKIATGTADGDDVARVMSAIITVLVPELPEYSPSDPAYQTLPACLGRLLYEGTAPIIGTNPVMASGFLCDHLLFALLRQFALVERSLVEVPPAPGYLYFDAGFHEVKHVMRTEVSHADIRSHPALS